MEIVWIQEYRHLDTLKPFDKNPRRISKEAYAKLIKSLQESGYNNRLLINTDDTVLAGHQRLKALKEIGYDNIAVLVPNRTLSEQEMKQIIITDNISLGEFDMDMLANCFEIKDLIDWGMDPDLFPKMDSPIISNPESEDKEKCPQCGK